MFLFCASESTVEVNCGVRISGFSPVNALQVKGIHLVLEWPPNGQMAPALHSQRRWRGSVLRLSSLVWLSVSYAEQRNKPR